MVFYANRLKPCHKNIGNVEKGELVTLSTLGELFQYKKESKKDST